MNPYILGALMVVAASGAVAWFLFLDPRLVQQHAAEQAIKDTLKDPDSARFRRIVLKEKVICGQVNAKNAMGGYTGFAAFMVDRAGHKVMAIDTEDNNAASIGCGF
jgi:hypothetical protein